MFTTNHKKRPMTEPDKELRFGSFRAANRVAFAADREGPTRHTSAAQQEAACFAHLCMLSADRRRVGIDVDGARIHGRLALPSADGEGAAFSPEPFADGSIPHPTRNRGTLAYTIEGLDCWAEVTLRHPHPAEPWRISVPRRLHLGTDRLAARHPVYAGWSFAMRDGDSHRVRDLSVLGAALAISNPDIWEPGDSRVGELIGPRGLRLRTLVEVRQVFEQDGEHRLGIEFQGLGFTSIRTLARHLTTLPRGTALRG